MPSPIAHTAVDYAVYQLYARHRSPARAHQAGPGPRLFLATIVLSLIPDFDFLPGVVSGDFDRFHNGPTHSLFFGLLFALAIGAVLWLRQRKHFAFWFGLTFICYERHVIMDFFTVGRGVLLFWPVSLERYEPAVKLFYGLHRSGGWLSIKHLWTVLTELGFTTLIVVITSTLTVYTRKN